jgi:hypothetical protein
MNITKNGIKEKINPIRVITLGLEKPKEIEIS